MNRDLENKAFEIRTEREFKALFDAHFRELSYFATSLIRNEAEANDIVMQVFTNLWDKRSLFESEINAKAYLYISVRNTCFNYLQRKKFEVKYLQDSQITESTFSDHVFEKLCETELIRLVVAEIETLPEKCKMVAKLSFLRDMSNEAIAERLGISVVNVSVQKTRAKQLLRTALLKKGLIQAATYISILEPCLAELK